MVFSDRDGQVRCEAQVATVETKQTCAGCILAISSLQRQLKAGNSVFCCDTLHPGVSGVAFEHADGGGISGERAICKRVNLTGWDAGGWAHSNPGTKFSSAGTGDEPCASITCVGSTASPRTACTPWD